jgi:hypothetical protein
MGDLLSEVLALYTAKALASWPDKAAQINSSPPQLIGLPVATHAGITAQQWADGLVAQLSEFNGAAYFCWDDLHHQNETTAFAYTISGGATPLDHPLPPDLRVPVLDDAIQKSYLDAWKNYFGEPLNDVAVDQATKTMAHVWSGYPSPQGFQRYRQVLTYDQMRLLVINGTLILGGVFATEPNPPPAMLAEKGYVGKSLAELVVMIDRPRNPSLYSDRPVQPGKPG